MELIDRVMKQTDDSIAVALETARIAEKAIEQRDELAAVLRELEAWCALATKGELVELSPARMKARAVLAKITGE